MAALLRLTPFETEKRRRVWWQLQHLDMILGLRSGSISLSLIAPWDTKLPLNIEDEDIDQHMREPPVERQGFSWLADTSMSRSEKDALLDRLDAGLSRKFVQYCDPIRPRDMLIQICARAFVCGMRRMTLHPIAHHGKLSELSENHRTALLDVCIKALEYDVALHSNNAVKDFQWRYQGHFQWSALIYVLVEVRRQGKTSRAERLWTLNGDLYAAGFGLSDLEKDRRKLYAAELARESLPAQQQFSSCTPSKPAFLIDLEKELEAYTRHLETMKSEGTIKRKLDEADSLESVVPAKKPVLAPGMQGQEVFVESMPFNEIDLNGIADFDFDAIEWSFWDQAQ
ncbi:MAG: hypothetical protein Q9181_007256 [Wetmoreana brouardii]